MSRGQVAGKSESICGRLMVALRYGRAAVAYKFRPGFGSHAFTGAGQSRFDQHEAFAQQDTGLKFEVGWCQLEERGMVVFAQADLPYKGGRIGGKGISGGAIV